MSDLISRSKMTNFIHLAFLWKATSWPKRIPDGKEILCTEINNQLRWSLGRGLNVFRFPLPTLIMAGLIISFGISASPATVTKVDGPTLLVEENESFLKTGEIFFVLDKENKKRALIRITETNKHSASAELIKGKAEVGWSLLRQAAAERPAGESTKSSGEPGRPRAQTEELSRARTSVENEDGTEARTSSWKLFYRVGFGLAYFTILLPGTTGATPGYTLGAQLQGLLELGRGRWGLEAGLMLTQMGMQIGADSIKVVYTLDYLGFPALIKYSYLRTEDFDFGVKAGFMEAYLLSKKESITVPTGDSTITALPFSSTDSFALLGAEMGTYGEASRFRYSLDFLVMYGLTNTSRGIFTVPSRNFGFTTTFAVSF